jgi:hypothetical protein
MYVVGGRERNMNKPSRTLRLYKEFYKKYPDVAHYAAKIMSKPSQTGENIENPAHVFVSRQVALLNKGFNQKKAFSMVEEELSDYFEREKEEQRILRGFAFTNRARSYLSYA